MKKDKRKKEETVKEYGENTKYKWEIEVRRKRAKKTGA
jgi:hypothetical protein